MIKTYHYDKCLRRYLLYIGIHVDVNIDNIRLVRSHDAKLREERGYV